MESTSVLVIHDPPPSTSWMAIRKSRHSSSSEEMAAAFSVPPKVPLNPAHFMSPRRPEIQPAYESDRSSARGDPALTHPRAMVRIAARYCPRWSSIHPPRFLMSKSVRKWWLAAGGSNDTICVRRARSPPNWALLPVASHSRSLGAVTSLVWPRNRSVHVLAVSNPSKTGDLTTPARLSNSTIGAVVVTSVAVIALRSSASSRGISPRCTPPCSVMSMLANSVLPVPGVGGGDDSHLVRRRQQRP